MRLCGSKREATGGLIVVWVDGGGLSSSRLYTSLGWTWETDGGLSGEHGGVDSSARRWKDVGSLGSGNRGCIEDGRGRCSSDLGGKGQNGAIESLRELHLDVFDRI